MQPKSDRQAVTDFAETFPKIPALQRHMVRCGKTSCRCSRGQLHESWRLVWRDQYDRQRRRYVPRQDVEQVREILESRRAKRDAERFRMNQALADLKRYMRLYRHYLRTGVYDY